MKAETYFKKNGFIWGIGNALGGGNQYLIFFDDWNMFYVWSKDRNNVWCTQSKAEKWQKKYVG